MEDNKAKASRITANSMKYLDRYDDETMTNSNYVPENIQGSINDYIRNSRSEFDRLTDAEGSYDKSSDEHIAVKKEKEHIAKTFVNIKNQIDQYKQGISGFKKDITDMSKGTSDLSYITNAAIYGNQFDEFHIDKDGMFNFLSSPKDVDIDAKNNYRKTGEWNQPLGASIKLDDIPNIIKEPYGQKAFVFKLAEKTKVEKDSGKPFDGDWTYNSTLNNLTEAGPDATIATAFTDLAGDGQTKSFARMYEEGLKDEYYVHPDTGKALPKDVLWMKDPANAGVLSKILAKYVTNTMKDIGGGTILTPNMNQKGEMIEKINW